MFIFSFLAHMTVAGTLIYVPYHFPKNDQVDHSDQIIWGIVENQVTGTPPPYPSPIEGEGKRDGEKSEVGSQKLEERNKNSKLRSQGSGVRVQRSEIRNQKQEAVADSLDNSKKTEDAAGLSLHPMEPVDEVKSQKVEVSDQMIEGNVQKSEGGMGRSSDLSRKQDAGCNEQISCTDGITSGGYSSIDKAGDGSEAGRGNSLKAFLEYVRVEIERHKYYPVFARTNGIEGTVYLNFHIGRDGEPESIELGKSSGSGILDESAIRTLKRIKQFSFVPEEIRELDITVPIAYKLMEESKKQ